MYPGFFNVRKVFKSTCVYASDTFFLHFPCFCCFCKGAFIRERGVQQNKYGKQYNNPFRDLEKRLKLISSRLQIVYG